MEKTRPPTPRRRGPSPAKTEATQRALLDAALAEFLDKGFAATRMSDVALRAGLAKGTTYLHFQDKQTLFERVMQAFMRQTLALRPMKRPHRHETTHAFLKREVPPALHALQHSGRLGVIRLIVSEGQRFPEAAKAYRAIVIEPMLRLVRVYARRAERRSELPAGVLSRLPVLMAAPVVISGLWNSLFADGETLDVADVFEAYLELVFGHASTAPVS